ncbi:MAG: isoprenylcysteine carboxylmethyltransferase family protein, partial [Candidatus Lokiarchaeota archaeon]|nr:isoprenylcysteine carboxylmethyltransferase family protein [Candidatus Lokiarchaeota archaeon]
LEFPFISELMQTIGFSFTLIGNISLFFAYRELGENWAYPIDHPQKKQNLVTSGIYRKIRHPIYLSFYIICIGFLFIILIWQLIPLYIIGVIGIYFQALQEEKILLDRFGKIYEDYIRNSGRFFFKI